MKCLGSFTQPRVLRTDSCDINGTNVANKQNLKGITKIYFNKPMLTYKCLRQHCELFLIDPVSQQVTSFRALFQNPYF